MPNGLLVVNAFLKLQKFDAIYQALLNSASSLQINLTLQTNAYLSTHLDSPEFEHETPDFVLFWDKDVRIAQMLAMRGIPVFNSAESIEQCDDKALTYLALRRANIAVPRTVILPKTFPNIGYTDTDFLTDATDLLGYPLVLKECFGSFGQQVYLMRTPEELRKKVLSLAGTPMLLQELITESFGRDIRINVVGGKIVATILRENRNGDFRSNLTLGGSMTNYTPTDSEAELALRAVQALGLAFAGVDVLFGGNGPLICEVNSNAHFQTTLECTGVNMADAILLDIAQRIGLKR